MTVAEGTIRYSLGVPPVTGSGLSWSDGDLQEALAGPVADLVFDRKGKAQLSVLLESIADTEFERDQITRVLNDPAEPENWRVGEALAESYLIQHRRCEFPWPDGRDERKAGSSLPGADLVGFQQAADGDRFAFGEVKTSGEAKYPPQAMFGRTGLKQQLEDLRDKANIRDTLVKYLGHRAVAINAPWSHRYRSAAKRYLAKDTDVQLYGLLVRDVSPHENDLKARTNKLGNGCPTLMGIELLGVYLPADSIAALGTRVKAAKKGGAHERHR